MSKENTEIIPASLQKSSLTPVGVDDYGDLSLTDGAANRLSRLLSSTRAGLVSISPLICSGPSTCPFKERCPIYQDGKETGEHGRYPVGLQCIVEVNLARDRFLEYVEEFGVGHQVENSPTIRSQISKLAELDLYDYRVGLVLAGVAGESDGTLLLDQTIAVTQDEEEVKQKQEHPAWRIKERIHKQRMELLDALGATIKRKVWIDATLKRTTNENVFQKQMQILERVDGLMDALEITDD
jgi:hypothetical protein